MTIDNWNPMLPDTYRHWAPIDWMWNDFGEFPLIPSTHFYPSMDVYSEEEDVVVKMELPEVKSEDLHIELEDSCLAISGRHEREEKEERKDYYRKERFSGSFSRRIPVPREVKEEDIAANLEDGVLEVRLKGAAKAVDVKRRIPIETS